MTHELILATGVDDTYWWQGHLKLNESLKRCTNAISSSMFYFGRVMYIDRSYMHPVVCYYAEQITSDNG